MEPELLCDWLPMENGLSTINPRLNVLQVCDHIQLGARHAHTSSQIGLRLHPALKVAIKKAVDLHWDKPYQPLEATVLVSPKLL